MDLFAEVRARADLPALVRARVPGLRERGRELVACCPFHEERTPSFTVYQRAGEWRFHCFGCGAGGSAVDWLVQAEGLDPFEAAKRLAGELGIRVPEHRADPDEAAEARARREAERRRAERLLRALDTAARYYRRALQANRPEAAEARWYVARRGLGAAVADWGLGYAPGGRGIVDWLGEQGVSEADRVAAGVTARDDDGREYPRFRRRLMLPIRDRQGRVVSFAGRDLTGEARAKYLNGPDTPVFHKREVLFGLDLAARYIRETGRAVIVEGQIDAVSLALAGLPETVALQGSALSPEHARALVSAGCRRAVLVPDGDARIDLERALATAMEVGLPLAVAELPPGEGEAKWDPDAVARAPAGPWGDRPGADWLAEQVARAPGAWRVLCRRLADRGLEAQELAAAIERELKPLYERAGAGTRAFLVDEAADALGVGKRAVRRALGDTAPQRRKRKPPEPPPDAPAAPGEPGAGPLPFRESDRVNAIRLVRLHGRDLRWSEKRGRWYLWDGRRWLVDWRGGVYHKAEAAIDHLWQQARASQNGTRQAMLEWALKSEDGRRIQQMITLARHHVAVDEEDMDPDPGVLCTPDGVVELAGLSVRPHRREDLITKITACGIEFTEPRLWLECLNVWMDGDREMIHFLKRLCGMSLFGEVTEHILPIHHGDGRNGKSTCLGTIQSILGDYATTLPIQVLLHQERTSSGPTPELAELKGMRFVTSVEPDEGVRLAEGLIKQLTGDDPIKARYLHRNPIEFNPSHTIHLAVNRLPQIRGRDRGIWRRVKKIPWVVEIPEHKQDKRLKHKLRDEWPRILGWLVEGAAEYHADGLQPPRKVLEATGEYESREDIVGRFLAACCSTGEGLWVYAGDLYRAYERWAEGAEAVLSQAKFGRAMTELGFRRSKSAVGGRTTYEGVGLLATGAEP